MKMHTKGRKAIAAILDVAVHGTRSPVRIAEISERQRVSVSYLEQLFQKLRQKGFVVSYRGPGGGYQMARRLSAISVADVINAVDGETAERNPCNGSEICPKPQACVSHGLWCRVNGHLHDYLRSVTLESILADAGSAAPSSGISSCPPQPAGGARPPARHQPLPAAVFA